MVLLLTEGYALLLTGTIAKLLTGTMVKLLAFCTLRLPSKAPSGRTEGEGSFGMKSELEVSDDLINDFRIFDKGDNRHPAL